jgi:membrane-bound lytic murein transglycosylase B
MRRATTIIFLLSSLATVTALPVFAQEDSATLGVPATADISSATSTEPITTDQLVAGRALLGQYLLSYLGAESAYKFMYDPRLILDTSLTPVNYATSTGTGFNYFSDSFGLTSPTAIKDGLAYRAKNWAYFKKARAKYGVDSYYILGILRLETYFGASIGRRDLPSTFYSIFVLNPSRRNFAWTQLAVYLDWAKRNKIDPFAIKGSSAGAYGLSQFIPTSVSNFGVDGNGDGKVNLFHDADAIMSIANYLRQNGWGANLSAKQKSVYSYNHDMGYVNAVLAYGDALKHIIEK